MMNVHSRWRYSSIDVTSHPAIGFNVETVQVSFSVFCSRHLSLRTELYLIFCLSIRTSNFKYGIWVDNQVFGNYILYVFTDIFQSILIPPFLKTILAMLLPKHISNHLCHRLIRSCTSRNVTDRVANNALRRRTQGCSSSRFL